MSYDLPVNVVDFRSLQSFKRTFRLIDLSNHWRIGLPITLSQFIIIVSITTLALPNV